jgi:archaellum component FlaF (FlaF/FlaG flagellin family)
LSFFDDVEEETRVRPPAAESGRRSQAGGSRPPRGGGRSSRSGGRSSGGRRGAEAERAIRVRRAVAGAALLIVVILIVLGVQSCTASQASSALRSYSDNVNSLVNASNQTGDRFFTLLSSGSGSSNATNLESQVEATRLAAVNQLRRARGLSAPSQVAQAQRDLVLTMQMRRDGIGNIARQLEPALQGSSPSAAVYLIAAEMARLYASDVVYKDYSLPMIERALRNAGITYGGINGLPVDTGQFVPNIQWLTPSYVAAQLHSTAPTNANAKPAPGIHGHELDSCSVGGTALTSGAATSLPAGSPPTLTCTVTNDGQNTETNVVVRATLGGTSITGQAIISQTQPGQTYTVQVPLSPAPPAGTYSLTVRVERVPGETTLTHNAKTFPVTFG